MGQNSKYYDIRFDRRSQNFGFHMIARSQLIADDRRRSQTIADDRRTFCDLRSAIRDRLRSYGNQPFVFFFQWLLVDARNAFLARFVTKTVLYGIWRFRNKPTFHNGNEDSRAVIGFIKTDIRKRISLDRFRLSNSNFASAWESSLCFVCDSSYHVFL